jgi:hypothetical protein
MSFSHVGRSFQFPDQIDEFRDHVREHPSWKGCKGITFHHSYEPSLSQRLNGLTDQHIINIRDYYRDRLGWSAGPHLFADDRRIMCMTPLSEKGVHAKSFNSTHVGIEVLGNYDTENPFSGRGARCWENAALAASIIMAENSLESYNFHRDDPKTDKSCPGKRVTKAMIHEFLQKARGETVGDVFEKPADASGVVAITVPVIYREGRVLVPIAEFLRSQGVDAAWDSGTWGQVEVVWYDKETETSYGEIGPLMNLRK